MQTPASFLSDPSILYFHTSAPWGYRALYSVVAPVMDVLLAAELLSSVLLVASLLLAWKIGASGGGSERALHGLLAVVALVILIRWSEQKDLLPPVAFQRTFALPLLLLTLWSLVSRQICMGRRFLVGGRVGVPGSPACAGNHSGCRLPA